MSENVSLSSADGVPPNIQRILSKLEAEPLSVNRDELFFQAGYAAGSSSRTSRFFWPSAAAALLLVSAGLAAVLAHQIIRSGLAPGQTIAVNHSHSPQLTESVSQTAQASMPADIRSKLWQRLTSSTTLPRGQLTAIGWSELPAKVGGGQWAMGSRDQPDESHDRQSSPHRPSTYLELMRSQNEG
jgi:hypothetical protein